MIGLEVDDTETTKSETRPRDMKTQLIRFMNDAGFDIADISVCAMTGKELVGKRCTDGDMIYWPIEKEGSGFVDLFKGSIKNAWAMEGNSQPRPGR